MRGSSAGSPARWLKQRLWMQTSSKRSMKPLKPSSMMLGIGRVLPFRTRGLPIVFDFVEEERLFELALVEGAPAFYVGATQDPLRRWVGDPYGDEQLGAMPGHREAGWNEMRVVHVAHGGAAASLEARLIREAMELHPSHCRNAVPDARGLSRRAINFVYIVV